MTTNSDEDLLQRIAAGDRLAMRVLFSRHQLKIHRFVLRMVRDEAVAEDAVSDTFLDVWRDAGTFSGRSQVTTWLMSIARFKALSALRRRRDLGLDEEWAAGIADDADTPEVISQKADKGAVIRLCMERLTAEHREVLDLVYYHETSVEEVAEIVGIPEGTVKTRLFHARKKLAELLQAAGIDRGWP
ncbi:sigma-70 family RNA polymerase sigma factor [Pinisolibacter sp.]|jgi:RNA polymerase sigma-70 factor (ECF subfamily)|uniref:sigma-70 family RNA polymerase sigma factor n=1 Tax=Pinisolibacter sp. TaxID=2172024 RepID=UPI002FDE897B